MTDLSPYPLAQSLRKALMEAAAHECDILSLDISAGRIKARVECDVCSAVNDAGKPLYSNETLRSAAVAAALEDNELYETVTAERRVSARLRAEALAEAEAIKCAIRLECARAQAESSIDR